MTTTPASRRWLPLLNTIAYVLTVFVNFLSSALPLNGRSAGDISDSLPSYFTPAGYAFAIWGLIYLSLGGFVVYQALPAQRQNPHIQRIGPLFVLASLANIAWIFSWHYGLYALSILFMVSLLAVLLLLYVRLGIGLRDEERAQPLTRADKLLIDFPMSIYFAWINVATVANIASVAPILGWNGSGIPGPTWAVIMMLVATAIGSALLINRANLAYAGVLVWALMAIRAKQGGIDMIATTALIASAIIVAAALVGWWRHTRAGRPQPQPIAA